MFLFQIWDLNLNGHCYPILQVMLMFLFQMWDLNGHCYHILQVIEVSQPADVGSILVLKRSVLAVGWAK